MVLDCNGATVGDFLDKPVTNGGLALSRPVATLALAVAITLIVYWSSRKRASVDAQK